MTKENAEKLVDALIGACEIHAAMFILGTQESANHLAQVDKLCDDLRDCVIGELSQRETQFFPVYTDSSSKTWDHGPVTCTPLVAWTSSDSLDGKVS